MKTVKILFFLVCPMMLVLFSGCQRNSPVINNNYYQLNVRKDVGSGKKSYELSLFLNVSDEDGIDDIEMIQVFNDEEELYWELEVGSWEARNENDQHWIGTNTIRMTDGSQVPKGEYRIVLKDVSGESDMKYINLNYSRMNKRFPDVTIDGRIIKIAGTEPAYAVRIYDNNDLFLVEHIHYSGDDLNYEDQIVRKLNIRQDFYFDVYFLDAVNGVGYFIGPYYPKRGEENPRNE